MHVELPPGFPPEEERAVLTALEAYVQTLNPRPEAWTLAGRAEALRLGALQIRHQSRGPWRETRLSPYTRRGTETLRGRGDAK